MILWRPRGDEVENEETVLEGKAIACGPLAKSEHHLGPLETTANTLSPKA